MKKMIALILGICLMTAAGAASAHDGEITFQQIPWGSSIAEVETLMESIYGSELTGFYKTPGSYTNTLVPILEEDNTIRDYVQLCVYTAAAGISGKIAGYENPSILFVFAVPADKDLEDPDNGELICAGVMTAAQNRNEANADLKNKLTQVYGEPDQDGVWIGSNDTLIWLIDANILYVKSAKRDKIPYHLYEAPAATPVPSNDVDPSDAGGL